MAAARASRPLSKDAVKQPFWAIGSDEALDALRSGHGGLDEAEASRRLTSFGPNRIREKVRLTRARIVLDQFRSPLILVLVAAGGVTVFLQEWLNAGVIFSAVAVSPSVPVPAMTSMALAAAR